MQRVMAVMLIGGGILFGCTAMVAAQGFSGRWGIQPVAGGILPAGEFGKVANPGFSAGTRLRWELTQFFSMDLSAEFGPQCSLVEKELLGTRRDPDGYVFTITDVDGGYAIARFAVDNNIYLLNNDIRPYISYGLGGYRVRYEIMTNPDTYVLNDDLDLVPRGPYRRTETRFGAAFGLGVECAVSKRTSAVVDFKYHAVRNDYRMITFGAGLNIYFNAGSNK